MTDELLCDGRCPACGGGYDWQGLDLRYGDGGAYVQWLAHCWELYDLVGRFGWAGVFGQTLEDSVRHNLGVDVREVYISDSLARFSLSIRNPGPGVRGWQTEVFEDIDAHHSHHGSPAGWKFGLAVYNGPAKVGVAAVGRPVSRHLDDGKTLEVTRVCTFGDARLRRNAASKLYGAARAESARRDYKRLVTYTLETERASSVRAANFVPTHKSAGGSWSRSSRPREDSAPTCPKIRWELGLNKPTRADIHSRRISDPTRR